ncbi:MAG: riboflavin synthase [Gammaproteobacteria bacterium]|nr:riboflavin synthase [Gammaproteobacteria bacterium]NND53653.1 riboflavin synthase [Gammaproteobacteria bacterium]
MFTGIVAAVGTVANIKLHDGEGSFRFATGDLSLQGVQTGDSIAVNGCCLTVTELHGDGFSADVSRETVDCTTLGARQAGDRVNFERALAAGDALGGHLVTGHIDGVGEVTDLRADGDSVRLTIEAPGTLARYIAAKGSVCVDGTSLTVNSVDGDRFAMMIIPHTQNQTIIGDYAPGTRVNIEVDIIARYLERFMQYTEQEA